MDNSIRKLRKKYVVTAFLISVSVISIMIFVLNFLMQVIYSNENAMTADVIARAAVSHAENLYTEYFQLSDTEQNTEAGYVIDRDIRKISSITMHGQISCENRSAGWYCSGGGLIFEIKTAQGSKFVYKEYTFNKDTTDISIDFKTYENVKYNGELISISEDNIVGDQFFISDVWWSSSGDYNTGDSSGVTLTIDSIEIHYNQPVTSENSDRHIITHSTFSEIFDGNIPDILSRVNAFYLLTDSNHNLISVNSGTMITPVDDEMAAEYIRKYSENNSKNMNLRSEGHIYSRYVKNSGDISVLVFVDNSLAGEIGKNLLIISILVGTAFLIILSVLILIISQRVVKPVSDSFERQKKFISNASHELKTPVTVISTTIDIISRQKGSDKWTECIRNQSRKMQDLVNELLDLSRLSEENTADRNFSTCDIGRIVNRSVLYFESRFFESHKELKCSIEKDIMMRCDSNKLSQLAGILIDNSLKYSDDNSTVVFTLKKVKNHVIIECTNTCTDFNVADTSMMFERFYRSDQDLRSEKEGFGLGLSIAKAVTELHKGNINVSYYNKNVCFTVDLPIE